MNQKCKSVIIIFGLAFVTSSLQAQEKKILTLSEAIQLSLQNSHRLKGSEAKIEEATAALKEAVEKKLPDASITGSYMRLSSANIDLQNKTNGGGTPTESPKVSQAMYGIANISMPLYAGSRIRYGIESSRYLQKATELDAAQEREEVIANTIEAYINLYKTKAAVNLVKENLSQSQSRVNDLSSLEKNGLLARNDLLKAELQSSNTELTLLNVENNWQLANVSMNLILGLPEQTELVPDSASLSLTPEVKTLNEYIQSALTNRKDVEAMAFREKAAQTGERAVKGEYYPALQLTGGYIAANIPKVLTITNAVNVGVGVSYNIGSLWKTKAKVQQAEARTKQLAAAEALLDDHVRIQVNQQYLNWLSSQKKIQVYAKAVEQALENYKITKNKYDNSLATTTELLDADVAGLQAKLNYAFAKADAVVAYNKLLLAAGIIGQTDNK
jgi:Outer membrane protein